MSKIARFDTSAGDAYAEVVVAVAASVWDLTVVARIPQATLDALVAASDNFTADLILIAPTTTSPSPDGPFGIDSPPWKWQTNDTSSPPAGSVTGDADVTFHFTMTYIGGAGDPWQNDWSIDGTPEFSDIVASYGGTPTSADTLLRVGGIFSNGVAGEVYFIKSVELLADGVPVFSDGFAGGDFSAWDTVVGDATVVDDGPPASTNPVFDGGAVFKVAV